jgi:hypothetical protein
MLAAFQNPCTPPRETSMAKRKRQAPALKSLVVASGSDAWATIIEMTPPRDSNYAANHDIVLELKAVVGVVAQGSEQQIDVVLTASDSNGPVADNHSALFLQPGVSTPVTITGIHHAPQSGTYSLTAIIFSQGVSGPQTILQQWPGPTDPPWNYRVN